MRKRRAPVVRTDGFVATLICEALADGTEIERLKIHDAVGRLAKYTYGKRNSPQYLVVEQSLKALEAAGMIESRYVPSHLKPGDLVLGRTYYKRGPNA